MQLWTPRHQHSAGGKGAGSAGWAWGVGTILLATLKPLVRTPVPVCPGTILPYAGDRGDTCADLMRFFVLLIESLFSLSSGSNAFVGTCAWRVQQADRCTLLRNPLFLEVSNKSFQL